MKENLKNIKELILSIDSFHNNNLIERGKHK
jgi:hypothetical protein